MHFGILLIELRLPVIERDSVGRIFLLLTYPTQNIVGGCQFRGIYLWVHCRSQEDSRGDQSEWCLMVSTRNPGTGKLSSQSRPGKYPGGEGIGDKSLLGRLITCAEFVCDKQ